MMSGMTEGTGDVTMEQRIRNAWLGRVSGCMLGKPVEMLSMREGRAALDDYLNRAQAVPLRDYVPLVDDTMVSRQFPETCRGRIDRSIPDDDINYTTLALMLLEQHGEDFETVDVARAWLQWLPGGLVFTAERDAYVKLLVNAGIGFTFGADVGFDLTACSDNPYNDWIGAQIRADMYGWVAPGRPEAAADMARRDAELSHRGEGVFGAQAVAIVGAVIGGGGSIADGLDAAEQMLPPDSDCVDAIRFGRSVGASGDAADLLHERYSDLSPVHTVNNLALVAWGLVRGESDFAVAIGDTVAAGWDTDCNGATVGALWGLTGREVPSAWSGPWQGRVETSLGGVGELHIDDLVARTLALIP